MESLVDVTLANYSVMPSAARVPAGNVTFAVHNHDGAPHNVVLIKTDLALDRLPTVGIRVDEGSAELNVIARTTTMNSGGSSSATANLSQGNYVLVCTVPHHYVRNLMAVIFTVE